MTEPQKQDHERYGHCAGWREEKCGDCIDRYGRAWDLPANERCPECGQPDNCGDCTHEPLSDEDAEVLA